MGTSTVRETDIGKIAITPRSNDLPWYDIIDLIAKDGRAYLSLKINNTAEVTDPESWLQITENSYDTALRLGLFEGTEAEWIHSLSAASEEAARLALEQARACQEATAAAVTATGKADEAADHLNTLSDHRDQIVDGYWWQYNEETGAYENTGHRAHGDTLFATFDIDPETGLLSVYTDEAYNGPQFEIDEETGMLQVII
ncbi:MAG: hypothetical protein LIP06_10780 [Tannerellaceae bacterium]|nr:hypothetical protein [Tannerellaceae bacterium]